MLPLILVMLVDCGSVNEFCREHTSFIRHWTQWHRDTRTVDIRPLKRAYLYLFLRQGLTATESRRLVGNEMARIQGSANDHYLHYFELGILVWFDSSPWTPNKAKVLKVEFEELGPLIK